MHSGPVAGSPHRQCWVDPGTGWKDSSAEDVQSWCVVDTQIGVHHRGGRIFAHAASAEVVAAADATKARTTPGLRRAHRAQDLLCLGFHPLGKAPLVPAQITGDSDERKPEPAAIAVVRVKVEKVGVIGQRLGLEADRADMLPASEVILILLALGRDVAR